MKHDYLWTDEAMNDALDAIAKVIEADGANLHAFASGIFVSEELGKSLATKLVEQPELLSYFKENQLTAYYVNGRQCKHGIWIGSDTLPSEIRPSIDFIHDYDQMFARGPATILLHHEYAAEVQVNDEKLRITHNAVIQMRRVLVGRKKVPSDAPAREVLKLLIAYLNRASKIIICNNVFLEKVKYEGAFIFRKHLDCIFGLRGRSRQIVDKVFSEAVLANNECGASLLSNFDLGTFAKACTAYMKQKHYSKKALRVVHSGLFIASKAVFPVCQIYANMAGSIEPPGTLKGKLKASFSQTCFYLVDGQRVVYGHLIQEEKLLDAFGYYHVDELLDGEKHLPLDDPIFTNGAGVAPPLPTYFADCVARAECGNRLYHIHKHAFDRFIKRSKDDKKLSNQFDLHNKRGCLEALYHIINNSERVIRKNAVIQELRHEFEDAEYRLFSKWILVIVTGDVLKTCYMKHDALSLGYSRIIDDGSGDVI